MTYEEEAVPVTLVAETVRRLPWAHLHLPPFPQVAIRVLQLTHNENVPLHQLCELISADAAFASEVLTVANSAAYAPQYPANSILQAIAVLGANSLQGMCVTVGVRAYLGKSMVRPAMKELWEHNLACALIAQKLAAAGDFDQDTAFTSGILHDIGRFALAVIQPKDYGDLLMTHKGSPESILQGERELFGWDHCETGQQLIASWQLPEQLNEIVGEHHRSRNPGTQWKMAELVKMSCRMADVAGFPAFVGCETTAYATLLEELPERERRTFAPDVEALATEIADSIRAIETV
jgi:putative nucleotidyltransferase with HDIG domain